MDMLYVLYTYAVNALCYMLYLLVITQKRWCLVQGIY